MKVNYLGREGQERMIRNGWKIMLPINYTETAEKMFERLSNMGYTHIKIYWESTAIRGLHKYIAMVKKENNEQ